MAKELYIYSPLYDFTAETVVKQLNEVSENEELTIRMNTPGGEVAAGWSIISKLSERKSSINAIIDGNAQSMGAMMLVFFDNVIANDVSSIMFHKASYPTWYEPNDSEKQLVKSINSQFKEKLTSKVNGKPGAKEFIDKIFEADVRNDVSLTPAKAKALGIVDEVRSLEPKAYFGMQIVATVEDEKKVNKNPEQSGAINNNSKSKSMDLNKLKAEHPALFTEVKDLGVKQGISKERERVQAWNVFSEIDPVKVKAGIDSDSLPSAKDQNEFFVISMNSKKVEAMEGENAAKTKTKTEAKSEEEIKAEANKAEMDELFNKEKEGE